jgi:outer membrane protein OmpA-like peptidoglycan-associated protein
MTLLGGCASTSDLYAKYEDLCEVPKAKVEERVKIVKEVVHKDRIVEKVKTVEKVKYVDRIQKVPTVKTVEKIKYVDRVQKVPTVKIVEKIKTVNKYIKQPMLGEVWEPAVYFGFDLATLNAAERARLDRDLLVLKKNPQLKLSVQAFTDSKGSTSYNRKLALQRQNTVQSYLMSKGLDKTRILVSPLGEELPILGSTETERVINRRVELMLLDATGRPLILSIQPKRTSFNAPAPVK